MLPYKVTAPGEATFYFDTLLGDGREVVQVVLSFEFDDTSSFNECIDYVNFKGIDISGCLTEETLNEFTIEALKELRKQCAIF